MTIDDVVALLMQLEPGDAPGAKELHAMLRQLLRIDAFISPAVLPSLAAAMRRVEAASHPGGGLSQADLDDLSRLLGDAVRAIDGTAAPRASAPLVTPAPAPVAPAPVVGATNPSDVANLIDDLFAPKPAAAAAPVACAPVVAAEPETPAAVTPTTITLPEDSDLPLIGEFVAESREYLEAAEAALLALESDPDDAESVNTIFRAFHTIKGTSAFLALDVIADFAHHAESVLSRVRDKEIRCTGGYADLALRSCDMLKSLLVGVRRAIEGGAGAVPAEYADVLRVLANPEAHGVSERAASKPVASQSSEGLEATDVIETRTASSASQSAASAQGGESRESSVRVRTDRLDMLIDMVGELVIAQAMIAQDGTILGGQLHDLSRKVSHAGKIVRELQDLSMGMRMVPLKGPFQKVARVVRDTAAKQSKEVVYVSDGEDVEIDRNLVDVLGDPLVHMVRNSVDHGIESPDARVAAGKPRVGTVRLSAYHSGGNVVVELKDDGRGLDRAKIIKKAIATGLITSGDAMSDGEVYALIFAPGFSTADVITDVSGRGVGMDVVRRNIEKVRGRIEIQSTPGQGTTFIVRLPLTLAITDGMLVQVGAERYIVPTINIQLSFRPERSQLSTITGRAEMVMLRGEIIPLVRLHRVFEIGGAKEDPTAALLMIVGDGADRVALLVDELLGQQQVVAKPLTGALGGVGGLSGSAILGDGRVGLILDVPELVSVAREGNVAPPSAATLAVA